MEPPGPPPTRRPYAWIVAGLWVAVLLAVSVRVGLKPERQSVYTVDYATAGHQWLHGQEVYRLNRHFVYSPLTAAAFVPFSLLPEGLGNIVWRWCSVGALLLVVAAWLRGGLAGPDAHGPPGTTATATVFLLMLPLCVGNMNNGQINPLVFVLVAGGVLGVRWGRWNLAALLLAAAAFVKIYPLAIGMLLALLYPRRLLGRLVLALLGLFVLSLLLQRPAYAWGEYGQWFGVLGGDNRLETDIYATWRDFGFLLRASGVPLSDRAYRLMEAAAGGALALFLWTGQRWQGWDRERLLVGVLYLGCAWMLLFGPATESATYVLLALPLCAALVAAWTSGGLPGQPRGSNALRIALTTAYALMVVTDAFGSWFHNRAHHLYTRAQQPVAALIFAGALVWWLWARGSAASKTRYIPSHDD